ncbi:cytochrome c biogenesis protein ResB [Tsukamurella soli]|uniref:Cytochrome c biogenesis protein ResB n=1 Tax=Tsukamurella soli TaxID=644556 RepID=A0ABP8JRA8_9ACTN
MTDTKIPEAPASPPRRPSPVRRAVGTVRNMWRSLTAMRTALVLLFLLALAAVPGALLPQRELNEQKTEAYIAAHGWLGRVMNTLQLFEVFKSVWFTAIYALLFISLVGCLTPRIIDHYRALRTPPVPVPRNLARLPRRTTRTVDGTPEEAGARIVANLRGWRKVLRTRDVDGVVTVEISAERGYLRELGNLVFHFALLGILVALALGKVYGYEGSRIVVEGDDGFCNTTSNYDNFRAGSLVDGTGLAPFCLKATAVSATYHPNGEPDEYISELQYQNRQDLQTGRWEHYRLEVNKPLRMEGVRVYMLGHGYAPTFTVTFPGGQTRTQTVQFAPQDSVDYLSSGAMRFDPPSSLYRTDDERRKHQIGLEGLLAPTKRLDGTLLSSSFPALRDPAVAIDIYEGDTGLDSGRPQNLYSLSRDQIDTGQLVKQARVNLDVGQSTTLKDGTQIRFDGVKQFAALQVSHDPTQDWVLLCAISMLVGLLVSLTIKRRRVFARLVSFPDGADTSGVPSARASLPSPDGADTSGVPSARASLPSPDGDGRTLIEVAGLARTDQAGWNEDFDKLADRLVGKD